jgi:hypothetical protein
MDAPTWLRPQQASEDAASIPLKRGNGVVVAYTLIDAADLAWASQWEWRLDSHGYANRCQRIDGHRTTIRLHRELLGLERGDPREGDHIDRNPLNNRRTNLRVLSKAGNRQNRSSDKNASSRFRGVCWHRTNRKWAASVRHDGRLVHLGYFSDEVLAGEAARQGRLKLMPNAVD